MDVFEFEQLSSIDQWDYFWENSVYVDSWKDKTENTFLFYDQNDRTFYMELIMDRFTEERRLKALSKSEAKTKYLPPHERANLPWE